jgi:Apea-like HEPN
MAENLLRDVWADLDQADLRLLFEERFGRPGQYDGDENVIHLPLAREQCRISLTYKGAKIVAIEAGLAFDRAEWDRVCAEIEGPIMKGPLRVGRDISFNTKGVTGWWLGERSGVQILPAPENAPRATEGADNPFILEFPIQDAGEWPTTNYSITNQRRRREHQKLTLLLNLLLGGTTKYVRERPKHLWASVRFGGEPKIEWVQELYFADFGQIVVQELSTPVGEKLEQIESEKYYKERKGLDGRGLSVPDDLDESICRYQSLPAALRDKFDRAAYWLSMASRQWEDSMSASYASLVSAAEALTPEHSSKHSVYCPKCGEYRTHDVPGATEKFRSFFEKYTPDPGLRERRSRMYGLRSKILHGSDLMQLDQGRAIGWDPPWWNEREMNTELWGLMRTAARNWLKDPT